MGPNQPPSAGTHRAASKAQGNAAERRCLTIAATDSTDGKGGAGLGSVHGSRLPIDRPDRPSVTCAGRMQSGALRGYI